ncbi:MAG: hypothetical protein QNJ40_03840 [Xanthomonadales bacterium]|nr:hypothetical protein [Xanthomonadales bacterium]
MRIRIALLLIICVLTDNAMAEGLRGDPAAVADARSMVGTMGGIHIWKELEKVHFVHEWDIANRHERYLENEILDLTGPRSWVTMKSESYDRVRAYSPEYGYWSITNGKFARGDEVSLANAMERAPYSIYRIARSVARDDESLEVRFGTLEGIPGFPALEFADAEGVARGWIILNARKEPVIWATTQYVYVFGPLARFGNLWVPNWATTNNGLVRYEMVSLTGHNAKPQLGLFAPPEGNPD